MHQCKFSVECVRMAWTLVCIRVPALLVFLAKYYLLAYMHRPLLLACIYGVFWKLHVVLCEDYTPAIQLASMVSTKEFAFISRRRELQELLSSKGVTGVLQQEDFQALAVSSLLRAPDGGREVLV